MKRITPSALAAMAIMSSVSAAGVGFDQKITDPAPSSMQVPIPIPSAYHRPLPSNPGSHIPVGAPHG